MNIKAKPAPHAIIGLCKSCLNPVVLRHEEKGWETATPKGVQDIRLIANEESIGGTLMALLPEAIENLPVLPEVAQRILSLLREPEMSVNDLVKVINEDQVIALRILKLANSAMYGGLMEIKDLKSACARLGMRVISNAVQTIANGRLYKSTDAAMKRYMEDLWRHAVASAHCANEIATVLAEPCTDIYFVAGLIHDVGKVLLLDILSSKGSSIMRTLNESPELFQEVLSQYHALVGLHIIDHWNLPPEFGLTTFFHEAPENTPDDYWNSLVNTITLASAIANTSGFGNGEIPVSLLSMSCTKFLGLNDVKVATLRIEIEDKVAPLLELLDQE
jgi:HD-like signal output (HDOD) protein